MTSYLRSKVTDLQAATGDEIAAALQAAFNDKFTGENAVSVKVGGDGKLSFAVAGGQQFLKLENYTPADGTGAGNFVTTYIKSTALTLNSNIRSTADYKGDVSYSDSRGANAGALFKNPFSEYQAYTATAADVKKPFSDQDRAIATIAWDTTKTMKAGDTIALTIGGTAIGAHTITAEEAADTSFAKLNNNLAAKINANATLADQVLATAGNSNTITIQNMTGATIAGAMTADYTVVNASGATMTDPAVAWSTPVAADAGLGVTAATNDTLSLTVGSTSSSVTLTAGTYSTLEDIASEINLQIEKSGMFQGDNAVKATVYSGNDVFHADKPTDVNKYLVLESAGGKEVTIAGNFVTAGVGFFGTERNTEINATRILSSLGLPWNNLQTANKVDGGIDTTAGAGVVSVTVANGSSSITKQVTLGNQSATRAFSDFASDLGSAINAAFAADGYSVNASFAGGKLSVGLNQAGANTITLGGAAIQDAFGSATVTASGSTGEEAVLSSMTDVAAAINQDLAAANSGVTASFDAATGKLKFEATTGVTGTASALSLSGDALAGLQFGNSLSATGSAGNATNARISDITVLTTDAANASLASIDNAIQYVSDQRANLGAIQNRLEHTVNNLTNIVTNTEASRSAIMDADYSKETTALAKSQILTQAATAMLAQANQSAQGVLSLLK
jgi:flagellin-like hook-associated protein FlgL